MGRQKKNMKVESSQKEETNIMTNTIENDTKLGQVENDTELLQKELDLMRVELEKAKVALEERKKAMPMREVDEDEMVIIKKQKVNEGSRTEAKAKIERQRQYDNVMITGKFINRRNPGKPSEKLLYQKYDSDPVKWYDFADGGVYTIPRGFAEQIRDHYYMPKFKQTTQNMDPSRPTTCIQEVDTSNKKYDFVPVNF